MLQYFSWLKNPLVGGLFAGLLIILIVFLDAKYNDKDLDKDYYTKIFASVAIVTAALIYYAKSDSTYQIGGSSQIDFDTGAPDF